MPSPGRMDLVARRIVFPRATWDRIIVVVDRLKKERGVIATPAEIAGIILEAGLDSFFETSRAADQWIARLAEEAKNRPTKETR